MSFYRRKEVLRQRKPLMRSITEHCLGDEPKHVMGKEYSAQEKEKYT
jgi:hypothetical protein